jgi:hypothetical protein
MVNARKRILPVISDSFVGSYDRIRTEASEIACFLSIQPKSREALIRWFVKNPFGPLIAAQTSSAISSIDQSISL